MRQRIYVAGPITKGNPQVNLDQARAAGLALIKAGFAPLVPHFTMFYGGNTPAVSPCGVTHNEWLACDLPWVASCDALLRLPGESVGADREVQFAQGRGIPVFHSIEGLIASPPGHRFLAKPRRPIIGFCGRPGAGKDACGQVLKNLGSGRWDKVSFADTLKDAVAKVYDLDRTKLDDFAYKESPHPNLGGMTPRRALQLIGTEGFRKLVRDDTWIEAARRKVDALLENFDRDRYARSPVDGVFVPDVRFRNEFEAIKSWGGVVVAVVRRDSTQPDGEQNGTLSHASERDYEWLLANVDAVIVNDSTLAALESKVEGLLGSIV